MSYDTADKQGIPASGSDYDFARNSSYVRLSGCDYHMTVHAFSGTLIK